MHERQNDGFAAIMVALAGVTWSFAGVLGKFTPWNALSLVGFRSLIAVVLLGLIRKNFRPANTLPNWLGGAGVIGTAMLFMFANKLTSAANAIVLQYAMTAVVIVAQALLFHIRPRRLDVGAAIAVMAGVALCFCQGLGSGAFLGDLLALLSAITFAMVFLVARMPGVDVMGYVYQGNLIGCAFLFALPFDSGIAEGGATGWLVALAMGACLALGYLFFTKGMTGRLSPTVAAVISNVEPVLNPTWAFLFLNENPGALSIAGAALVLAAVTAYAILNAKAQKGE